MIKTTNRFEGTLFAKKILSFSLFNMTLKANRSWRTLLIGLTEFNLIFCFLFSDKENRRADLLRFFPSFELFKGSK